MIATLTFVSLLQVMAMVMCALFFCWGPWALLGAIEFNGYYNKPAEITRAISVCFGLTNSVINPLLYVWNIPEFKRMLKRLFPCRFASVGVQQEFIGGPLTNESQL